MNSSVLAYLENSAEYFPEKCAVTDERFPIHIPSL